MKKQGMLGITFTNKDDYNKIKEDDSFDFTDLASFAPDKPLTIVLNHKDGSKDTIKANHTYNAGQILWFKAGSALNLMAAKFTGGSNKTTASKKPKAAKKKSFKKTAKKSKPTRKTAKKTATKKKARR